MTHTFARPERPRRLAVALVVLLLGTGYPRPDPEHAGPSTVVIAGDAWFVVDAGRGATMRIAATDLKYANLRGVFLTHLIPANAEETFRERAARKFQGEIVVGRDLLRVE